MSSVEIHLKAGTRILLKNLTSINVFYSNGTKTHTINDFNLIPFKDVLQYTFVSPTETLAISGTEIHFVKFTNN